VEVTTPKNKKSKEIEHSNGVNEGKK